MEGICLKYAWSNDRNQITSCRKSPIITLKQEISFSIFMQEGRRLVNWHTRDPHHHYRAPHDYHPSYCHPYDHHHHYHHPHDHHLANDHLHHQDLEPWRRWRNWIHCFFSWRRAPGHHHHLRCYHQCQKHRHCHHQFHHHHHHYHCHHHHHCHYHCHHLMIMRIRWLGGDQADGWF